MSELSSDVLRGYNDTIILSLLRDCDSYGYQLSKMIRETSQGSYVMKETTLYSAINRLEKAGWLHSYAGEVTRGKPRIYYQLTDTGRAQLTKKLDEWKLSKEVLDRFFTSESRKGESA